ncbi:hypothetical protein FRC09_015507 [Ceratobasidium sp. 395]|nr:hypothetical protein FRC09_015507 [Ceratobasidium sp. 395]
MVLYVSAVACKNAHPSHSLPLASQLRARARSQAITYGLKQTEAFAINPAYRLYSSLPPGLTPETQKAKVEPVFTSPASKKTKIELKPGPRPVNALNHPSDAPRPATAHAGAGKSAAAGPQSATSTVQPKIETTKSDEVPAPSPPSKIKMAIADIVKAAEAGALVPPPKDASKLGKLWHQASRFHFKSTTLNSSTAGQRAVQIVKDIKARVREEKNQGISSTMTWEEAHFIKTYQEDLVKVESYH